MSPMGMSLILSWACRHHKDILWNPCYIVLSDSAAAAIASRHNYWALAVSSAESIHGIGNCYRELCHYMPV